MAPLTDFLAAFHESIKGRRAEVASDKGGRTFAKIPTDLVDGVQKTAVSVMKRHVPLKMWPEACQ